jgi:hypothetical protein
MLKNLSKGDDVVLSSGIFGQIVRIEDDAAVVHVEIAPEVRVKVKRDMILESLSASDTKQESQSKDVAKSNGSKQNGNKNHKKKRPNTKKPDATAST